MFWLLRPKLHPRVARKYHAKVAARMATHVKQTLDNINRSTWVSAKVLAKEASVAQLGAIEWQQYLQRTRESVLTSYDKTWKDDPQMMSLLNDFVLERPAVVLWRKGGKYARIFKFLAMRFLTCPDSVLDCERVHAIWYFECTIMGIQIGGRQHRRDM